MTTDMSTSSADKMAPVAVNLPSPGPGLTWHAAMNEEDLWEGDMVSVTLGRRKLLFINMSGEVRAYDDKCPHKGTRLSDGTFEDGMIICPTHHWEFDARNGAGINPTETCLTAHPIFIADAQIWVALGDG